MQQLAQGIASLGRGEDKMLVHMTPGEVAGLQALAQRHGGSLTINPHTGLPEAGFLSSILPMVGAGIGLALAPATGGASMWAMGGGALGGMLGSSMEHKNPLLGGLMGGISGYGMSGLADALTGMGTNAITEALPAGVGGIDSGSVAQIMSNGPQGGISGAPQLPNAGDFYESQVRLPEVASADQVSFAGQKAYAPASMGPGYSPATEVVNEAIKVPSVADATRQTINPSEFVGDLAVDPSAGTRVVQPTEAKSALWEGAKQAAEAPGKFLKQNWKNAAMMAAPLITAGIGSLGKQNTLPVGTGAQNKGNIRPYTYSPGVYDPNSTQQVVSRGYATSPYFSGQGYMAQPIYAAAMGGSVPNENQFYPGANIARSGQNPTSTEIVGGYDPKLDPYTGEPVKMAEGGIASLGTYAAGGKLLQGPGDGMSDSIPAVIQGEKPQRAALAQGEFVIPADVVSHLGNGSTDAGSKRLYAMMDKVRHARTGTKKQGKQINAEKFLPA